MDFENAVYVFIGPEGGFAENEKILFKEKNIQSIALAKVIFRTETAAILVASLLNFEI